MTRSQEKLRRLGIIVAFLFGTFGAIAQQATVTMKDGSVVIARLKAYSDHHLHTSSGIFELRNLQAVQFATKDEKKAGFFVEKLRATGVLVLIGDKRLEPTGTADTLPESTEITESPKRFAPSDESIAATTLGIGLGLDYGGFGLRFSQTVNDEVNLFLALGYAISRVGIDRKSVV